VPLIKMPSEHCREHFCAVEKRVFQRLAFSKSTNSTSKAPFSWGVILAG
jgi:hypothetical protein